MSIHVEPRRTTKALEESVLALVEKLPFDLKVIVAEDFETLDLTGNMGGCIAGWRLISAAVLQIAVVHIHYGTPLELPETVIEIYRAGVEECGPTVECERCGYTQPPRFIKCVLCSGKTGRDAYYNRIQRAIQNN